MLAALEYTPAWKQAIPTQYSTFMKNAPCIVSIIAMLMVTSCQRRALCKTKTTNGGNSYIRIYEKNFNSLNEYNDAISEYKKNGYTCDDSVAVE